MNLLKRFFGKSPSPKLIAKNNYYQQGYRAKCLEVAKQIREEIENKEVSQ